MTARHLLARESPGRRHFLRLAGAQRDGLKRAHNPKVAGSNPAPATKSPVQSLVRPGFSSVRRGSGIYSAPDPRNPRVLEVEMGSSIVIGSEHSDAFSIDRSVGFAFNEAAAGATFGLVARVSGRRLFVYWAAIADTPLRSALEATDAA